MRSPLDWVARQLWYGMLWFMRRPRIKRFRLHWHQRIAEPARTKAWNNYRRQERWARRYGLKIMQVVVTLFSLVILSQLFAALVYTLQAQGAFRVQ